MKNKDNAIVGIYKITNPINEVYIGQSTNMKNRKSYYKSTRAKGQPKICNSIKTHGWENHVFEVIEECSLSILDIKEEHHKISYIIHNGWNKALFCRLKDGRGV